MYELSPGNSNFSREGTLRVLVFNVSEGVLRGKMRIAKGICQIFTFGSKRVIIKF